MLIYMHPLLFCFGITFSVQAQYYFSPELQTAYYTIIKLKTSEGLAILHPFTSEKEKNGIALYLQSLATTTEIFVSEDPAVYLQKKQFRNYYIKAIEDLPKNNPYYRYCLAEVYLQWALVQIKGKDEMNAALDAKKALQLLNENLTLYPAFIPTKKSLGLLNILIGSIPTQYNWITTTLGFKGNITIGKKYLQEVIQAKIIFSQEAQLYYALTQQYVLQETADLLPLQNYVQSRPDNLLWNYVLSSLLLKQGKAAEALAIIEKHPTGIEYTSFPFIQYTHGEALLITGSYAVSRVYFLQFIQENRGKNLIKDAYYKLFLSFWLMDQDAIALTYWNKVDEVGQLVYEADKYAQKQILSNELPNKILTKIRLYTDGGLFQEATELFNTTGIQQMTTYKDKLEYYYRSARLYHKMGQLNTSVDYYKKVIQLSKNNTYYFAPNSALQLGYIYAQLNNIPVARHYFQLAINFKNHEYENSIEQKAKAGLAGLPK